MASNDTTAGTRPKMKAESILALMQRQLPPARWGIDDPQNDEELLEDIKHLTPGLREQLIHFYQLVRHSGLPQPTDSIEDLLKADNPKFWTTDRIFRTICDLAGVYWARRHYPDYDQTEAHYIIRGVADRQPWRLWSPWRNGHRLPMCKLGLPDRVEM